MKIYLIGLTAWTIAVGISLNSTLAKMTKNDCIYGRIDAACLQLARNSK